MMFTITTVALEKRRAIVRTIKEWPEYAEVKRRRDLGEAAGVPGTPDPEDRSISKRKWEASRSAWIRAVKAAGQTTTATAADDDGATTLASSAPSGAPASSS